MKPRAYYNENDPRACAWLRELMRRGLITDGEVDERSITEVKPGDLKGFTRYHFFAGIGVWDYALTRAGWDDSAAGTVFTGSCPCQPFSAAGRRAGHEDERHLWPTWFRLIRERRPFACFGEQVAGHDGEAWLDVVATDLESLAYSVGAVPAPACGFGAPHERDRTYFVADTERDRQRPRSGDERGPTRARREHGHHAERRGLLGDSIGAGLEGHARHGDEGHEPGRLGAHAAGSAAAAGPSGVVVDAAGLGREMALQHTGERGAKASQQQADEQRSAGPVNGFWADAEWLPCRDGKARPVEPGTFPLAHGAPARVVRLRGYGNAINAEQAQAFIAAYAAIRGLDLQP